MRSRLLAVLVGACGLLGCVSFPGAHLLQGQAAYEVVQGPVVCGPVGFRKVPLQSRWGEYVRVTVAAPSALRGTVLVHANGVAQEAQAWSTEAGPLILEARFPNESVERPFALERERPIDITLTGLEALGGGTCEGAVFTVEHGALRPSIDERAWIAELTRRGGPELAARLEAARLEADARRQAHYAQWESRHVEVSAEVLAQASAIREAHYAQWDARHSPSPPEGERVGERGDAVVAEAQGGSAVVSGGSSLVVAGGSSGACAAPGLVSSGAQVQGGSSLVVAGGSSSVCAAPGVVSSGVQVQGGSSVVVSGGSSTACAAPGLVASGVQVQGGSSVVVAGGSCSTCAAPGVVSSGMQVQGGSSVVVSGGSCSTCPAPGLVASGVQVQGGSSVVVAGGSCSTCAAPGFVASGVQGGSSTVAGSAVAPGPLAMQGGGSVALTGPAPLPAADGALVAVSSPGEWIQPPEASLRASASVESAWVQPFEPRLETVAVTTESQMATALPPPRYAPQVVVAEAPVDPALGMLVPAFFQVLFNVAAASPPPQYAPPPQRYSPPVHGARPIPPGGR